MKTKIKVGSGENIAEVAVRKSKLSKRVVIKFSNRKGFELVVPFKASLKQALDFLYKKEDWVLEKNSLLQQKSRKIFINNTQVPILGNIYTIKHSGALRGVTKIEGEQIVISGLEVHIPRKTKQFLVELAKSEIEKRAKNSAKNLGVCFKKITIRDAATRWGSCTRSGNLSFSWRLVMAPDEVLEYVVAHEISHLLEMNHSKKFWEIVAKLCPDYKHARNWLRTNGAVLHEYTHSK